jgi:hypothetical protein
VWCLPLCGAGRSLRDECDHRLWLRQVTEWLAATSDGVAPTFSAMACCAGGGIIRSSVAAADPDRAGELATDAELIARALTDNNLRAWALALTAEAVAAADPGRAARLADAERAAQAHNLKARALARIADAVAAVDLATPLKGERPVEQVHDGVARLPGTPHG